MKRQTSITLTLSDGVHPVLMSEPNWLAVLERLAASIGATVAPPDLWR